MFEVSILDKKKPILLLRWKGVIPNKEVNEVTKALKELHDKLGGGKYYLLVDVSELKIFNPDTKESIVEQQRQVIPHIHKVAVVINKSLVERQLKEVSAKSGNDKEINFPTYEEALQYLLSF